MSRQDAIDFMTKDSSFKFSEEEAIYCYGMCKMTVVEEVAQEERSQVVFNFKDGKTTCNKAYFELQMVEFVELLGRMAELLHRRTQSPVGKAAFLLSDNFPLVK